MGRLLAAVPRTVKELPQPIRDSLAKRFFVQELEPLEALPRRLSPAERVLWWLLVCALVATSLFALNSLSRLAMTEVPDYGGSLTEGVVGTPRFVNPLLALSDADRDLTALVYSGLLRAVPDGTLIPDLAESYALSEDGLIYTVKLREDAMFHDGEPVTAADVLFTIERARDPAVKSPKRPSWEGVEAERVDERTVRFTLREPYAPFLENLTLGILPRHRWGAVTPEEFPLSAQNTEPVGSGPYRIRSVKRDGGGIPVRYELTPFSEFALGRPYLSRLTVRFYGNEDALLEALARGEIESAGGISYGKLADLASRTLIREAPLPRVFAVFMNQNQAPLFAHQEVRRALDRSIDREALVHEVLGGYGSAIGGPIPPGIPGYTTPPPPAASREEAAAILESAGWARNPETGVFEKKSSKKGAPPEVLAFTLATSNAPELKAVAERVKAEWEALGARVELHLYETGDLQQNVIRPRKYDALLFGEIVGRELDLFAFWDSSQRNDPGLNIALYTSPTADNLLQSARGESDARRRFEAYRAFELEVTADVGAIFLYSPNFIYAVPERLRGVALGPITTPGDRFAGVYLWHRETNRVWNIFAS